ncbi:MAG: hypothetical protein QXJ06_00605 [Candidatus Aenigmatarchaeota archaeon]
MRDKELNSQELGASLLSLGNEYDPKLHQLYFDTIVDAIKKIKDDIKKIREVSSKGGYQEEHPEKGVLPVPELRVDGSYPENCGTYHWLQMNYPFDPPNDDVNEFIRPAIKIRITINGNISISSGIIQGYLIVYDKTQNKYYMSTKELTSEDANNGYFDIYLSESGIMIDDECHCILVAIANSYGYTEKVYEENERKFIAGSSPNIPETPILLLLRRGKYKDVYKVIMNYKKDLTEPYNGQSVNGCCNYYAYIEVYTKIDDGILDTPEDNPDNWEKAKHIKIRHLIKKIKTETSPPPIKFRIPHEINEKLLVLVKIFDCFGRSGDYASIYSSIPKTRPGTPEKLVKLKSLSNEERKVYKVFLNKDDSEPNSNNSEKDNTLAKRMFLEELIFYTAPKGTGLFNPVQVCQVILKKNSSIVEGINTNWLTGENPSISEGDSVCFVKNTPDVNNPPPTYSIIDILSDTKLRLDNDVEDEGTYYMYKGFPDTNPEWEEHEGKIIKNASKKKAKLRFSFHLSEEEKSAGGAEIAIQVKDCIGRKSPFVKEVYSPQNEYKCEKIMVINVDKATISTPPEIMLFDPETKEWFNKSPSIKKGNNSYYACGLTCNVKSGIVVVSPYHQPISEPFVLVSKDFGDSWELKEISYPYSDNTKYSLGNALGQILVPNNEGGFYRIINYYNNYLLIKIEENFSIYPLNYLNLDGIDEQSGILQSPLNNNKIYIGNDLTVPASSYSYYSVDGGRNFNIINNNILTQKGFCLLSEFVENLLYKVNTSFGLYLFFDIFSSNPISYEVVGDIENYEVHTLRELSYNPNENKIRIIFSGRNKITPYSVFPVYICDINLNDATSSVMSIENMIPCNNTTIYLNNIFRGKSGLIAVEVLGSPLTSTYTFKCLSIDENNKIAILKPINPTIGTRGRVGLAIGINRNNFNPPLDVDEFYQIISEEKDTDNYYKYVVKLPKNYHIANEQEYSSSYFYNKAILYSLNGGADWDIAYFPSNVAYTYDWNSGNYKEPIACLVNRENPVLNDSHPPVYIAFHNTETERRGIIKTTNYGNKFELVWRDDKMMYSPPFGTLIVDANKIEGVDANNYLYVFMPIDKSIYTENDWAKLSFNGGYDLGINGGHKKFFKEANQFRFCVNGIYNPISFVVAKNYGVDYPLKLYYTKNRFSDYILWSVIPYFNGQDNSKTPIIIALDYDDDNILYVACNDGKIRKLINCVEEPYLDSSFVIDTGFSDNIKFMIANNYYIYVASEGENNCLKRIHIKNKSIKTLDTPSSIKKIEWAGINFNPFNHSFIVITTRDITSEQTGGLYVSLNNGDTITQIAQGNFRSSVFIDNKVALILGNGYIYRLILNNLTLELCEGDWGSNNRNFVYGAIRRTNFDIANDT